VNEYSALYWAAACLVFWAGSGVTKGQFAKAVDKICCIAKLSVPQEVLFKRIIRDVTNQMKRS